MRILPMRRRAHTQTKLPAVALATLLLLSGVSSRVLHQSSGDTADQLVSDGSDSPPAQASLHSGRPPVVLNGFGPGKSTD